MKAFVTARFHRASKALKTNKNVDQFCLFIFPPVCKLDTPVTFVYTEQEEGLGCTQAIDISERQS